MHALDLIMAGFSANVRRVSTVTSNSSSETTVAMLLGSNRSTSGPDSAGGEGRAPAAVFGRLADDSVDSTFCLRLAAAFLDFDMSGFFGDDSGVAYVYGESTAVSKVEGGGGVISRGKIQIR